MKVYSTNTPIKLTGVQCAASGDVCFISICPELSWRPEKTLPPDLAGMGRMKQHERWAGMLLKKAGVQQLRHWEGLEMWRGSPFVGEVYLWENAQAAQAEVESGLFSYSSTKKDCVALFRSFIALLLSVWEVRSHGFYTLLRLKLGEWAEITLWHDDFNKECPAARTNSFVCIQHHPAFLKVYWRTDLFKFVCLDENLLCRFSKLQFLSNTTQLISIDS